MSCFIHHATIPHHTPECETSEGHRADNLTCYLAWECVCVHACCGTEADMPVCDTGEHALPTWRALCDIGGKVVRYETWRDDTHYRLTRTDTDHSGPLWFLTASRTTGYINPYDAMRPISEAEVHIDIDEESQRTDPADRERIMPSRYDADGYNSEGFDRNGYNRDGYNSEGYDRDGYDRDGYDEEGRNTL